MSKSGTTEVYTHFENMNYDISMGKVTFKYCQPPSTNNGYINSICFVEWPYSMYWCRTCLNVYFKYIDIPIEKVYANIRLAEDCNSVKIEDYGKV